jgi:hypothetical protein
VSTSLGTPSSSAKKHPVSQLEKFKRRVSAVETKACKIEKKIYLVIFMKSFCFCGVVCGRKRWLCQFIPHRF